MKCKVYSILFLVTVILSSCNNLKDEQFEKYVIFARNGFFERELEYKQGVTITTEISAAISGTDILKNDIQIGLTIDEKILAEHNFDKFRNDEALYYKILPTDSYQLQNKSITIKSGDEYGTEVITINPSNMDMYTDYVLPISIGSVSDYNIGEKKYASMLMNIIFKNSFSGLYAMSAKLYDYSENVESSLTMNSRLRVVNANTCYMYAGNITESNVDKARYIINVQLKEDGTLNLSATNPDIEFVAEPSNIESQVNVAEILDGEITLFVNYTYLDLSVPGYPVKRKITGKLYMATE